LARFGEEIGDAIHSARITTGIAGDGFGGFDERCNTRGDAVERVVTGPFQYLAAGLARCTRA
jgi:hypothetical protein